MAGGTHARSRYVGTMLRLPHLRDPRGWCVRTYADMGITSSPGKWEHSTHTHTHVAPMFHSNAPTATLGTASGSGNNERDDKQQQREKSLYDSQWYLAHTSRARQVDDGDGAGQGRHHVRVEAVVLHHQDDVDVEHGDSVRQELQAKPFYPPAFFYHNIYIYWLSLLYLKTQDKRCRRHHPSGVGFTSLIHIAHNSPPRLVHFELVRLCCRHGVLELVKSDHKSTTTGVHEFGHHESTVDTKRGPDDVCICVYHASSCGTTTVVPNTRQQVGGGGVGPAGVNFKAANCVRNTFVHRLRHANSSNPMPLPHTTSRTRKTYNRKSSGRAMASCTVVEDMPKTKRNTKRDCTIHFPRPLLNALTRTC